MGYRPNRVVYNLDFEGTELDGLQVKAASTSVGVLIDMTAMADLAELGQNLSEAEKAKLGVDAIKAMRGLITEFAKVLRSWNLEDDDGSPVPADEAGLRGLEFPVFMKIVQTWMGAAASVSAPLPSGSPSGGPSLEASIPMDVSSPSPAS